MEGSNNTILPHSVVGASGGGVGLNATFWCGGSAANSPITHVSVGTKIAPAIQGGNDYNLFDHWFANIGVKHQARQ